MMDLSNVIVNYKEETIERISKACKERFKAEVKVIHDDMFLIIMNNNQERYMVCVKYDLGLAFLHKMSQQRFVLGGNLIDTEVIGSNTAVYKVIGNGEGGYELKGIDPEYAFRHIESYL